MDASRDERVIAIRADNLIGTDSCSFIDECLSDADIVEELDRRNIVSPVDAIKHLIDAQHGQYERGLGTRAGDDDDPILIQFNDWVVRRDAHLLTLPS